MFVNLIGEYADAEQRSNLLDLRVLEYLYGEPFRHNDIVRVAPWVSSSYGNDRANHNWLGAPDWGLGAPGFVSAKRIR